jgi:hypothetical protein
LFTTEPSTSFADFAVRITRPPSATIAPAFCTMASSAA